MSGKGQAPVVTPSAVISAGLASAAAASVTSVFGVAGTLIGAALTTMIITGGAAILKAYMESAGSKVRGAGSRLRQRGAREPEARQSEEAASSPPGRPDLRDNFVGRLRAALGWFSGLSEARRGPILKRGLIGAAIAFVIAIALVTVTETGLGNNLSCGIWGNCPAGYTAGFDGAPAGTQPTILGGGADTGASPVQQPGTWDQQPVAPEQQPVAPDGGTPAVPEGEPLVPEQQPADPSGGVGQPQAPAEEAPAEQVPAEQ